MQLDYDLIGGNVIKTRVALGLSQEVFSVLCGFSRSTLSDLENRNTVPTLKTLEKVVSFTKLSLAKLNSKNYESPANFREKLQKLYSSDIEKSVLLNDEPSVPYIIEYKVLKTDFLTTFKERKDILIFIRNNYGWEINPNTLSTNLKRMTEHLAIKRHPTKKSAYIYKRKNG